jgi:methylated-DNA-protein-cysteine methyltransferase related protein
LKTNQISPPHSFFLSVYKFVEKIPKGKVVAYSWVAIALGKPRSARAVGYALSALDKKNESKIPWQRVINTQGKISFKGETTRAILQRKLLENEGIIFDLQDKIDFDQYGWKKLF